MGLVYPPVFREQGPVFFNRHSDWAPPHHGSGHVILLLALRSDLVMKSFSAASVLDLTKPPDVEGFTPLPKLKEEGFQEKFIRKTKENPFVPIGMLGTAGALTYGLIAFKRGKTRQSQLLMRARIFAQGFTVAAILVGVVATALKRNV
ncbi:HIG1 domain family member 2A, mitochondrial [Stegostoma tigrinum]|uniref:HIG1 domain family member 2A, mitochondrial n=1 Tax=Stegostoma tigrinum TaxID=3053191 RepID=UPI00286FD965|nr:HIG1 domain family member 2A, mitochondrial [Stegostoma tigrinum]